MQMEPHRLFGRGRLKIKDSVVQDVGYLDKRVSSDLCLRTYLIESQLSRHHWIYMSKKHANIIKPIIDFLIILNLEISD